MEGLIVFGIVLLAFIVIWSCLWLENSTNKQVKEAIATSDNVTLKRLTSSILFRFVTVSNNHIWDLSRRNNVEGIKILMGAARVDKQELRENILYGGAMFGRKKVIMLAVEMGAIDFSEAIRIANNNYQTTDIHNLLVTLKTEWLKRTED